MEKGKTNYQQQSQIKRQEKRKKNNKRTCFANIMEMSYTTPKVLLCTFKSHLNKFIYVIFLSFSFSLCIMSNVTSFTVTS